MQLKELIGKQITNIYSLVEMDTGGLDTGECFLELDNNLIIDIPYDSNQDVWIKELNPGASSLFADLSDQPVYHVNKEKKTIGEIAANYQKQKNTFFNKLRKLVFGEGLGIKEYQPYKVEYIENKLKGIKGRVITDFIWYTEMGEKGYFLLDNGFLITDKSTAPNGTGLAGLNYYESLSQLIRMKGDDFKRLTDKRAAS
ncbi:MAG TPA: hypothetical protein VGO45_08595 [Bacteroidia bacterium]|jgi:hypothetical protein|nr:hypothetical protein [Bacteroidia bacterium]